MGLLDLVGSFIPGAGPLVSQGLKGLKDIKGLKKKAKDRGFDALGLDGVDLKGFGRPDGATPPFNPADDQGFDIGKLLSAQGGQPLGGLQGLAKGPIDMLLKKIGLDPNETRQLPTIKGGGDPTQVPASIGGEATGKAQIGQLLGGVASRLPALLLAKNNPGIAGGISAQGNRQADRGVEQQRNFLSEIQSRRRSGDARRGQDLTVAEGALGRDFEAGEAGKQRGFDAVLSGREAESKQEAAKLRFENETSQAELDHAARINEIETSGRITKESELAVQKLRNEADRLNRESNETIAADRAVNGLIQSLSNGLAFNEELFKLLAPSIKPELLEKLAEADTKKQNSAVNTAAGEFLATDPTPEEIKAFKVEIENSGADDQTKKKLLAELDKAAIAVNKDTKDLTSDRKNRTKEAQVAAGLVPPQRLLEILRRLPQLFGTTDPVTGKPQATPPR